MAVLSSGYIIEYVTSWIKSYG